MNAPIDFERLAMGVNWVGTPGHHQIRGVCLGLHHNEFALFWEPGGGKTYASVHIAKTRYARQEIDLLVVFCPNSIKQVWPREFSKWAPEMPQKYQVMQSGMVLKRPVGDGLEIIVVAIEAMSQGKAYQKLMAYMKGRKTMVICDESSRIKNPASVRTKNATNVAWSAWYRLILTGTPVLQGPHDLFAQMRFLNPAIIGITRWAAFKARYCIMGGFENRKIIQYVNVDELVGKIKPYADLVRLEECTDIPEKIYTKIPVPLSDEQRQAIRQLKDEGSLVIDHMGVELYVEMALERMTRIQQIVGGSLPTLDPETGKYKTVPLEGRIPKLDAMLDYIEDLPEGTKCIIWARFAPERDRIEAALVEKYGRNAVVRYDGTVCDADRKTAEERMQTDPDCLFFVGNQQVAGIGITLTAAKYALTYSNTFSSEDRIQMENRNHRTGQNDHCRYVDFEAMVKEDRMITKALALKKDLSEFVKDNMKPKAGQEQDPDMDGYE